MTPEQRVFEPAGHPEEADRQMHEDDRDGHHTEHQGGDEARGEAGGERNAAEAR